MPVKALTALAFLTLIPMAAWPQSAFTEDGSSSNSQRVLPSQGPGSARFNPSALGKTRLAYLTYGHASSAWEGSDADLLQMAFAVPWAALPVAVSGGFGYYHQSTPRNGANSVWLKSESVPGMALSFPANPDAPARVSVGVGLTMAAYSVFNALESDPWALDGGVQMDLAVPGGRVGLGYAYHHLTPTRVDLPDHNGTYKVTGWMEPALDWSSSGRVFTAHASLFINETRQIREGPIDLDRYGMHGWDFECRPVPLLGLKVERTRMGSFSNLGLVLHPKVPAMLSEAFLEFDVGHSGYEPGKVPLPEPVRRFLFGSTTPYLDPGYRFTFSFGVGV